MRLFGLKTSRYSQWREVLSEELRELSWRDRAVIAWTMLKLALTGRSRSGPEWRRCMRRCYRCPIFDRGLRRCRPYTGSPLGCGCWMPIAAKLKKHGWLTDVGDPDHFCW